MDDNLKRGFHLGEWRVEPMRGQLVGPSGPVHMEPKVMEVLVALAMRPGDVIERNELVDEVWAGRAVSDEPLNRCIAELRRILGDSRTNPRFVETVPKRGYRLVAPVKTILSSDAAADSPRLEVRETWLFRAVAEPRRRKVLRAVAAYAVAAWVLLQLGELVVKPMAPPMWILNALILAVVFGFPLAILSAWFLKTTPTGIKVDLSGSPNQPEPVDRTEMMTIGILAIVAILFLSLSARLVLNGYSLGQQEEKNAILPIAATIAVLPFTNLSEESKSDYFSDGLSEEILNRLSGVKGLTVVARTSSFSFRGFSEDAKTIADALAVAHLVNGSVRRDGDRIRISSELVSRDGFRLWSKSYEGIFKNIFTLQDTIANDIVAQIKSSLPIENLNTPIETMPPTDDLNAYELVLRGRFHLQRRDEGPLRRSISLFKQAIVLDEDYGDAYVGLATASVLLPFYSYETVESAYDIAVTAIEDGARKDPSVDLKAAGLMAFMRYRSEWKWIEAERGFRKALEYSPNNPELLNWYSQFLGDVGRTSDALYQAARAKQLDNLSPVVNQRLAVAQMWMNENDLALAQFELADELGMGVAAIPEAYMILLLRLDKFEEARSLMTGLQKILGRGTDWIVPVLVAIQEPRYRPAAVEAVIRAEQGNDISRLYQFGIWVYLNETDRALDVALEMITDKPNFDTEFFNAEFLFAKETTALRNNERFGDLVHAMGLDRYWDNFGWPEFCQREEGQIVCN